jgi:GDPmannose 4,6-dehydratase
MNIKMNRYCVIFGVNGQDGYYLKSILENEGFIVIGVSRSGNDYIPGDVSDGDFVKNLIITYQPAYIFHLAANSSTNHNTLFENYQTISTGSLNILAAVHKHSKHSKVFISGSGLQFVNVGNPISETDCFEARDSYSMARIQSVYTARYFRSLGIHVYIGYFFHHDSPLRHVRHLNMKIIKTALKIKNGTEDFLEIGNPNVTKEFNHAYDMMSAVWCLIKQDEIFEATIGSGIGYSIKDWINICFKIIGLDEDEYIKTKPNYNSDFLAMISNPETIKSLGWKPIYDIHYLANDMINNG